MQSRRVPNWIEPGKDGVHEFWLERLTNLHENSRAADVRWGGGSSRVDDIWTNCPLPKI